MLQLMLDSTFLLLTCHFKGAICKTGRRFSLRLKLSTEYEETVALMLCKRHLCIVLQRRLLNLAC